MSHDIVFFCAKKHGMAVRGDGSLCHSSLPSYVGRK